MKPTPKKPVKAVSKKEEVKARAEKARAVARYLRIGPRKMRLVIDAVRRRPAGEAIMILRHMNKKGARLAEKLLKSAVANAKVLGLEESKLVVADIRADNGPFFKRFMSRSMGRADRILKRTTHLSIELKEGGKSWGDAQSQIDMVKSKKRKAAAGAAA